jgi:hypothetical protein
MVFTLVHILGLVAVNAIPLAGVLWFGWNVFEVLILFWFENVAIGVAHTIRLSISTRTNGDSSPFSTTSFFAMHYGLFTFVHGLFTFLIFGIAGGGWKGGTSGALGPVAAIIAWQAIYLAIDTIRTERFRGRAPGDMMFEPYPRVFALHLTVLAGGWFVAEAGSPVWALAILVAIKSICDVVIALFFTPGAPKAKEIATALRKQAR